MANSAAALPDTSGSSETLKRKPRTTFDIIICAFLLQADGYLLVFALDDPDSFNLLTDLVPRWVAAFPRKICHN